MRSNLIVTSLIVGAIGGVLVSTSSASAQTTGNTPVTFQVGQGSLEITVPTATADLGTVPVSGSAQTVSAKLGDVTVIDNRGGTTGWTVQENGVDFTGPQTISVSAPGSSTYNPGVISTTGTVTATGTVQTPIYPPSAVVNATGVAGINTASWNPTISITVPANALSGTYSSTITHSVS